MQENIRKIEEITTWTDAGAQKFDMIMVHNFHFYNFKSGEDSFVLYTLLASEGCAYEGPAYEEKPEEMRALAREGTVKIPYDIISVWGEDDEPIFDYVISRIGLKKIT